MIVHFSQELYDEFVAVATRKGITPDEVLRRCIKLGLVVARLEEEEDIYIVAKDENTWKRLTL